MKHQFFRSVPIHTLGTRAAGFGLGTAGVAWCCYELERKERRSLCRKKPKGVLFFHKKPNGVLFCCKKNKAFACCSYGCVCSDYGVKGTDEEDNRTCCGPTPHQKSKTACFI